jgi:hypothetical protein
MDYAEDARISHTQNIAGIYDRLADAERRLSHVEEGISAIQKDDDGRLTQVEKKLADHENSLDEHQERLDGLLIKGWRKAIACSPSSGRVVGIADIRREVLMEIRKKIAGRISDHERYSPEPDRVFLHGLKTALDYTYDDEAAE